MNMMSPNLAADDLMNGLTPAQCEAASQSGAVVVLAGAGTGKTRTLVAGVVHRIVHRKMLPHRILAVTFTNKSAEEMKSRIAAALGHERGPSWVGTFHGHGRRQLRADPDIAGLRPGFDICDADDSRRIVRRLMEKARDAGAIENEDGERFAARVKSIATRISSLKEAMILPEEAEISTEGLIATRRLDDPDDITVWREAAMLYPAYQAVLRESNMADFTDLLLWPTVAMMRDESYRRDWAARFDAILADEFQDVNRLQFLWLKLLSTDHGELFALGDDAQSIYGWRGANVGIIRNFLKEFQKGRMIALEENFRSTGHLLTAANAVIAGDQNRLEKSLFTTSGDGEPIEIVSWSGSLEEAQGIAAEIGRRAIEGVPYEDMAILYRYNFLSRVLEEQLLRAKIPYELVNDTAFWQRGVVKDGLAFLRLSFCPDERQSDDSFRRVVNQPTRGIGAKSLAKIEQFADNEAISLFRAAELMVKAATGKAAAKLKVFLALIRTVDGGLRVSLKNALTIRPPDQKPAQEAAAERRGHHGGTLQSKMTLLGLLHLLWEESGLVEWSPAARRQRAWWPGVRMALHTTANRIFVGDTKLSDYLAMFGYNDSKGPQYFRATVEKCGSTRRVLLLGVLNHLAVYTPKPTVEGAGRPPRLRLGFDGGRPFGLHVFGSERIAKTLARSFPWAWSVMQRPWKDRDIHVLALVSAEIRRVEKPDGPIWTAWADDVALMETGPSLIPVASSHELAVLKALQDQKRSFRKPLRFDAHQDDVLPDFELLDTSVTRGLPMEVFGHDDETYAQRRAEKARYYTDVYGAGGWWAWDATREYVWPPFPPQAGARNAQDRA